MDTATAATTVALLDTETGLSLEARDDPAPGGRPGHAQKLLSLCAELLDRAELDWVDFDRLVVGTGPGTFTGLRIGIATAHALAQSTGAPLVGVSTLDSLALGAGAEPPSSGEIDVKRTLAGPLAVIDARRGEAFVGAPGRFTASVVAPAELPRVVQAAVADAAVGDGAVKFRAELEAAGASVPPDDSPLHRVDARYHCRLALAITPTKPTDVQPEYLRVPDAVITLRDKAARGG